MSEEELHSKTVPEGIPVPVNAHAHAHVPVSPTPSTGTNGTRQSSSSSNNNNNNKAPRTPTRKSSKTASIGSGSGSGSSEASPSASASASRSHHHTHTPRTPKPSSSTRNNNNNDNHGGNSNSNSSIQSSARRGNNKKRSVKSSSSSSSTTKKKGITFKRTVGVHTIPNLDTYTIQEKELTWYAPDDYETMEDECDVTAELLDRRKPLFPGQCPRGLEAWTLEGEQRKEGHVQLAIDIVWQAQLEQWKASSDIHECWEFIRSRYLAVSTPCGKIANHRAESDERDIKAYLTGVRNVEKNRLRLLGITNRRQNYQQQYKLQQLQQQTEQQQQTPRSSGGGNSRKKTVGRSMSAIQDHAHDGHGKISPPSRNHSLGNIQGGSSHIKGVLKHTSIDEELSPKMSAKLKIRHKRNGTGSGNGSGSMGTSHASSSISEVTDDDISAASSRRSRKISYKNSSTSSSSKSKSKIPTSPVQSVCSMSASDDGSLSRRMRSHMSVASDDSTRRRMLRTASIKPPLEK